MNDLDSMMSYWTNLLGLTPQNGWKVTWGWAHEIVHPDGVSEAIGLNRTDGENKISHITIRMPQSLTEMNELDDTCAHEAVHCLGVRMQYLLDVGKESEAHEYLAETLAPAMVKIKGTPKAKYLAKAARTLPARAKGQTNMPEDIASLEKAMIEARLAGDTAKVLELLDKVIAAKAAGASAAPDAGPPSAPPPELGAAPPAPEEKKPEPPSLGMGEPEARYKKLTEDSIAALVDMRSDLSADQKKHVLGLRSIEEAKSYFKAHPAMAIKTEPVPQLGLSQIPRGSEGGSKAAPSGDKKTMALFRVMPGAKSEMNEGEGIDIEDPKTSGKLVTLSIVGAFNTIRENTTKALERAKVRAVGGAA